MAKYPPPSISLQISTALMVFSWLLLFHHSMAVSDETKALLEFKNQLQDPLGYLKSWKNTESPCHFLGISCDPNTGRVTEISLDNKSLSGVISPTISQLKQLTSLVLPSNSIYGTLPQELKYCDNLKVLNVTGNSMNGSLPDLSGLKNLEYLDVSLNYFSGEFPTWVGNLSRLVQLGLGENDFIEGEIPSNLGNLKNLTLLYLAGSNLRGEIPESIFDLEALGTLDICKNKISGDFPKSISKLKNLWKVELYSNNLTGELPEEIGELTLLQEFDISMNQMSGKLPQGIGNLKKLIVFQLFENNFSGEFPPGFGDLHHLTYFSIYRNNFSGEFPPNLGRFCPLNSIDISENHFSGGFPKYLCEMGNLQQLLALDNEFSGEISNSYGNCKGLTRLRINQNQLSGKIPDGLWALPNAGMIDLSDNNFTGTISNNIGASTSLSQLMLSNNRFSGDLPVELGKLKRLERLYLNNNHFSGQIPPEMGGLMQLSSLHLEENSLTGQIPDDLSACNRLVDLNLASNSLTGTIPSTISQITSLNSLNLSHNWLQGLVPKGLQKLKLSSIDLSFNQLSGKVPIFLITMGGSEAFEGNNGLCIDNSSRTIISTRMALCSEEHLHRGFNKVVIFSLILAALVVILGGLLVISYWNFKYGGENSLGWEKETDPRWKIESFHPVKFDADEISNLDEESLIGSGGTGKVYRLDSKKEVGTVAVKQLWKGNEVKAFVTEMEILGKIRHKNVVKLYACLTRGGSSFLVFEYMENGNLYEALRREIKNGKPELGWQQRYRIALGAAKGLAYLHHDCSPPIVHRDVKSSNILLDAEYEPKIADFGVAKVAEISSEGSEASCFAGTYGYIAPELAYTAKITEKCDVYSFGVVLLELVTGKRPIEEEFGEGKDIVYWVSTHLGDHEKVVKLVDHKVREYEAVSDEEMIKVLKVAVLCTTKLPSLRPTMKEVVKMLVDAEPPKSRKENCKVSV